MKCTSPRLPIILLMLLLLFSGGCRSTSNSAHRVKSTPQATLALINGTLIDGTGAPPVSNAAVLVAGNRILAVGTLDTLKVPSNVPMIDVRGATILPGFINAHVHRAFDKDNLRAWAMGGVTTVRDESASLEQISGLRAFRAEIATDPSYARLVSAGTMIAVPGGYGGLIINTPEEAREAVLNEIDQGVDAIKVAMEDGYAGRHNLPKLTPEALSIIVKTAHENGLPVSAHITQGAYLQSVLDAGVDDIAHIPYDSIPLESLQQMVVRDIPFIPTFTVYRNYGAPLSVCKSNLAQFLALGGKVVLGNDYGGGPGEFELGIPMVEIQMMAEAGMSSMQIILASTQHAAHVLNLEGELGTLEPGNLADLFVVAGNPLEDLQALTRVVVVVHNGNVIRNEI